MKTAAKNLRGSLDIKKAVSAIIVFGIIVALVYVAVLYASSSDDDYQAVMIAVRGYLSEEQKIALQEQVIRYRPQTQDEEEMEITFLEFPASEGTESTVATSQLFNQLVQEIKTGNADLYFLDSYVYGLLGDETLFEDLSQLYPDAPGLSEKYRFKINGTDFGAVDSLKELPELYATLRSAASSAVNKNPVTIQRYEWQKQLLEKIVYTR